MEIRLEMKEYGHWSRVCAHIKVLFCYINCIFWFRKDIDVFIYMHWHAYFSGKLTRLEIGNNSISAKGAFHVAEYVKKTKSLIALNISMNDIGDEVLLLRICLPVFFWSILLTLLSRIEILLQLSCFVNYLMILC